MTVTQTKHHKHAQTANPHQALMAHYDHAAAEVKKVSDFIPYQLPALTWATGQGSPLSFSPYNFGLMTAISLFFEVDITAPTANDLTITPFGMMNLLSNVTFLDTNSTTLVNVDSLGLYLENLSRKDHIGFLTYANQQNNGGEGTNGTPLDLFSDLAVFPTTILKTTTATVKFFLDINFCPKSSLIGALFMNQVGATTRCQLTVNPNALALSTDDATFACYQCHGDSIAGSNIAVTITPTQWVYDRLPKKRHNETGQTFYHLPYHDMSEIYQVNHYQQTPTVANQDNLFPLQVGYKYRDFWLMMDTGSAAPAADIATLYNSIKVNGAANYQWANNMPETFMYNHRKRFGFDLPGNLLNVHFPKPLLIDVVGATNLIINPANAMSGKTWHIYANYIYPRGALMNEIHYGGSM